MPNNVILRRVEVTEDYRPLSCQRLVATVEISAPPTNSGPVFLRGDQGDDVAFLPAQWITLKSVDLSQLFVKGTSADVVFIIGGTWRD